MKILLDTNMIVRLSNPLDQDFVLTVEVLTKLWDAGHQLTITAQNIVEFTAVATRPVKNNGLGSTSAEAEQQAQIFESKFHFIADDSTIFPNWKSIVAGSQVLGKHVHDARLVAVAVSAGVDAILTFNTVHFQRLCAANGLQLLDPRTV